MLRSLSSGCLFAASALAALAYGHDARACGGGMFYPDQQTESVSVTGHSVVVSISKTRTVLWDRISYRGEPKDFAWIMPVAPGTKFELASAAWIEALVGGSTTVVTSPEVYCDSGDDGGGSSGGCCGSAEAGGDGFGAGGGVAGSRNNEGVTVVHRETVGPYEQTTVKSDTPGTIGKWLTDNHYAIPAGVQPILDDYAAQGLEFIALKLKPDAAVTDMKPVRVTMSGGLTTFPMRMLAAGAKDKVPINLVVIGEGRYEVSGFKNATVLSESVSWDFASGTSNYQKKRAEALAGDGGATWLTTFAREHALLHYTEGRYSLGKVPSEDLDDGTAFDTLGELYFAQGRQIGDETTICDTVGFPTISDSTGEVVELCADTTMPCSKLQPGQIDSAALACGKLDDMSTALVGMHPMNVWVTRLEAELPVAALSKDLTLKPTAKQDIVNRFVLANDFTGDPCGDGAVATLARPLRQRRGAAPIGALAVALGVAVARKASRRRR